VFVAALGFSHLLFAWAAEDARSRNWLGAHLRMFEFFGGVPHVLVPDCLKQGVLKCHLYDPDINPGYGELAAHYHTAVVPARPGRPKDKAIVEGLVKILMRYMRFRHRHQHFTSLPQINIALRECIERINSRPHSRFKVSRRERFEAMEKTALKPLPLAPLDVGDWRCAKLHPDCYLQIESDPISARPPS
jgi:transposase